MAQGRLSLFDLKKLFPTEKKPRDFIIERRWPGGICCVRCGSLNVNTKAKHKSMPFRCREKGCEHRFSPRSASAMEASKLTYLQWIHAAYQMSTHRKSLTCRHLSNVIGVSKNTAWHTLSRLRRAYERQHGGFFGPVECDETYVGGRRRNMHKAKRVEMEGRGTVGKQIVVGIRDRETRQVTAEVVGSTDRETLQPYVLDRVAPGARIFTDDHLAYQGLPNHQSVRHSVGQYVRGEVHTNGIESLWAGLKRVILATHHHISPKHLHRYVAETCGRHNLRLLSPLEHMMALVEGMEGKRLRYCDLVG